MRQRPWNRPAATAAKPPLNYPLLAAEALRRRAQADEALRIACREAIAAGHLVQLRVATGLSRSSLYRLAKVDGVDHRSDRHQG